MAPKPEGPELLAVISRKGREPVVVAKLPESIRPDLKTVHSIGVGPEYGTDQ